jgi:acyl-CoA reductase-like NAD-dependent aldehyde dehydrogenase
MLGKVVPCIIGGEPVYPKNGQTIRDINPADVNDIIAEFPKLGREEVSRAIELAEEAQRGWAAVPSPERGRILVKAANLMEAEFDELAKILTREEGKTLNESRAEVSRAISIF